MTRVILRSMITIFVLQAKMEANRKAQRTKAKPKKKVNAIEMDSSCLCSFSLCIHMQAIISQNCNVQEAVYKPRPLYA